MGLALMEDEWNERRRIQMTSIVGGIKGKHASVCVVNACAPVPSSYRCV